VGLGLVCMTIDIIYTETDGLTQVPGEGSGSVNIQGDLLVSNNFILGGVLVTSENIASGAQAADDLVVLSSSYELLSSSYVLTSGTVDKLSSNPLIINVTTASDFGPVVNGRHQLICNAAYILKADVDVTPNGFLVENNTFFGQTTFDTTIRSASTASLFVAGGDGFVLFEHMNILNLGGPCFDLDLGLLPSSIFMMHQVGIFAFSSGGSIGKITEACRVIITAGSAMFDQEDGLLLDGDIREVSIDNTTITSHVSASNFTALKIGPNATMTTTHFNNVRFNSLVASDRFVNFDPTATYNNSVRMQGCAFRGPGQFISTASLQKSAPEFIAEGNTGLGDSIFVGSMFFNSNTDITTILTQSVFVNVGEGTPAHTLFATGSVNSRFEITGTQAQNQELKYIGLIERSFQVFADAEMDKGGGGSLAVQLCIFKNGVAIADSIQETLVTNSATYTGSKTFVNLVNGDTITACVSNETDTSNFTVTSIKISVSKL